MEVIGSESGPLQWESRLIAPIAAMSESTILGFSAIAAAHDEELHGRFLVDAIIRSFKPVIEPTQSPFVKRQSRLGRKLNFAGDISTLAAVRPWPDDQFLGRFLVLGKSLPVEYVLPAPGIVPAGDVIDRHVSITAHIVHDRVARLFPVVVVVAVP